MNEQARQSIQNDLQTKVKGYRLFLAKNQEKQGRLSKVKEESGKCKICLGYCETHKKALEKHKKATCCDKSQGIQAYVHCSAFKALQKQIKTCDGCIELKSKKFTATISNPLLRVCLFDKSDNPEIYLLSQTAVC